MTKRGFYLNTDILDDLELLDDHQTAALFRAILCHEAGEELPELDKLTAMAFGHIRRGLEERARAYEQKVEKRRAAAEARWSKEDASASKAMQVHANASKCMSEDASARDTDTDTDTDTEKKRRGAQRMKRPTVEEVRAYCEERKNRVDAQTFVDFYEAKGWKVGRDPMKDWKACVRTWEKREKEKAVTPFHIFEQRSSVDWDSIMAN